MEVTDFKVLASRQINGYTVLVGERPGTRVIDVVCAQEMSDACADMDVSKYTRMQINTETAALMLNDIENHVRRKREAGLPGFWDQG